MMHSFTNPPPPSVGVLGESTKLKRGGGESLMSTNNLTDVKALVSDLYFDYDRLSVSGKKTLDKITDVLGIENNPSDKELLAMGLPKKLLSDFRQKTNNR